MATILHQNNFATNLTSAVSATDTTSPLNSIPTIAAPFYLAFDATNINGHYEVLVCTSKTATNVNHAALAYDHTTAEEVRMVIPAAEMDNLGTISTQASGVWVDWTPTFTNLTKGSASIFAHYTQIGKTVHFRLALTFAADTSISGSVSFTLPVTAVAHEGTASVPPIGIVAIYDSGAVGYYGTCGFGSTTTAVILVSNSSGAIIQGAALSSTVPMTWTTSDELHVTGTYEAA